MVPRNVELQNADKSFHKMISMPEVLRMKDEGTVYRITRKKAPKQIFRFHSVAEPSNARDTPCEITMGDMRVVAGLQRVDEARLERLVGFGLLHKDTIMPTRGYLKVPFHRERQSVCGVVTVAQVATIEMVGWQ